MAILIAYLAAILAAPPLLAYDGPVHQRLTFIAAQHFNRCVTDTAVPRLTPLQVRYIAKANIAQAEPGFFRRVSRWNYYDREAQDERNLLWFIETRMHEHYNTMVGRLDTPENLGDHYSNLGRVVNYLQDVTSPAHVVPVFTNRWWRFSVGDKFDGFRVDEDAIEAAIGDACDAIRIDDGDFQTLLRASADSTIEAVQGPISGMPVSWEVFWELSDNEGSFGQYGAAGNSFGRQAEFRCTEDKRERCVLLEDDPLYVRFAVERHVRAVRATIAAMARTQHLATGAVIAR
ncbi:MAG: hypothetical protein O7H39_06550 [Gammaproteobacteria bacterium]|nr:hypothetical protein [Gammaproteobacteria bacterium]